jgi:hypothetical protein
MLKLRFIGMDSWYRPVYRDESGRLWKDVNLGRGEPALYSASGNDFDGEPDMPPKDTFEIIRGGSGRWQTEAY